MLDQVGAFVAPRAVDERALDAGLADFERRFRAAPRYLRVGVALWDALNRRAQAGDPSCAPAWRFVRREERVSRELTYRGVRIEVDRRLGSYMGVLSRVPLNASSAVAFAYGAMSLQPLQPPHPRGVSTPDAGAGAERSLAEAGAARDIATVIHAMAEAKARAEGLSGVPE